MSSGGGKKLGDGLYMDKQRKQVNATRIPGAMHTFCSCVIEGSMGSPVE